MIGAEMSTVDRIRVAWSNMVGGPGVSTFYATDGPLLIPQLHAYFTNLTSFFPSCLRITCAVSGDSINTDNGELVGDWAGGVFAPVSGAAAGGYAAEAGALQKWDTSTILSGHRLRGHTFLVPLAGTAFDATGQVSSGTATGIESSAAALVVAAAGNMIIWQRPRKAKDADGSRKAITARIGGYGPVTGSRVSGVSAVLTSRRD